MTGEISLEYVRIASNDDLHGGAETGRHARQNTLRIGGAGAEVYGSEKIDRL
jgi:hypothetical protein